MKNITVHRKNVRRFSIRVDSLGNIAVSAPLMMKDDEINNAVLEHEDWIKKKVKGALDNLAKLPDIDDNELFYMGERWRFERSPALSGHVVLDRENKTARSGNCLSGKRLVAWYKKEAAFYLPARTALLAQKIGIRHQKAAVREAKRRWGSCSTRGTISLNSKLIMAPQWVSDAIILHELCHIVHHNHGKAFWDVLLNVCPGWKEAKKWLNEHAAMMETVWNRARASN